MGSPHRSFISQAIGQQPQRVPEGAPGHCERQRQAVHVDAAPPSALTWALMRAVKTPVPYLWSYCMTALSDTKAVVLDFADSRSGENVRGFLGLGGQGS